MDVNLLILLTSTLVHEVSCAANVSSLLNSLLEGYDSQIRPGHGDHPTVVRTDMNIRSMGPISEMDMSYQMDAYFRQTWVDKRLKFESTVSEMVVHIMLLERIWKPDTYFYNGRGSYLHTISSPNKLLRITPNGTLLYSMRLTIKASCPMYLQYFPVDEQMCPLEIGSYAYTEEEVSYIWKRGLNDSIKIANDMTLSQFDLIGTPLSSHTSTRGKDVFSTLMVRFHLQRHMGYFLIQIYLPCTLVVVLSWVSFWINREATSDRIGLGITTVLTLVTLNMDSSKDLPKVPYATSLDWFVLLCFGFVIASVLEFAGVHYFTKLDYGDMPPDPKDEYLNLEILDDEEDDMWYDDVSGSDDDDDETFYTENQQKSVWYGPQKEEKSISRIVNHYQKNPCSNGLNSSGKYGLSSMNNHIYHRPPKYSVRTPSGDSTKQMSLSSDPVTSELKRRHLVSKRRNLIRQDTVDSDSPPDMPDPCWRKFMRCLQGSASYRKMLEQSSSPTGVNSVSRIDIVSRILFPLTFIIINATYWIAYTMSSGTLGDDKLM